MPINESPIADPTTGNGQAVEPAIPVVTPQPIGPDTWLIPNIVPAEPGTFVSVNTMVILGQEPVVVDTGAPLHRDLWFDSLTSLVDPEDVRWVFLSHDDGDHLGNMSHLLERAPKATVIANFFSAERAALEPDRELPLHRMRWLDPGDTLDVGDRRLHLFRPPIFDGPTTRGIYDDRSGVMWAVDSFAALTTGAVHHAGDLPPDLYDESFALFNSMISPWHEWLDPRTYRRHVDRIEAMGATAIASAHGPILTGAFIPEAFERVRAMAGQPIVPPPGQEALDDLVTQLLAANDGLPA